MIKNSFLRKQIDKSKRERRTSIFLRKLIFYVVEKTLKDQYGNDCSMKCLQSSVAISMLMNGFGIKSMEILGSVCVSQVFEDLSKPPSWNGFWGDDHHVWNITEYGEFVDLTISALHLHPLSKEHPQIPVPAIWWSDTELWPRIIKYLPKGAVRFDLPKEDALDLEEFKKRVSKELLSTLQNNSVEKIQYSSILHGIDSLKSLYEAGDPWLKGSCILEEANVPHPPWVVERERQLMSEYYTQKQTR